MDWIPGIPEAIGVIGGGFVTALLFVKKLRRLYKEAKDVYLQAEKMQEYYRAAEKDGRWSEDEFRQMGLMAGALVAELADLRNALRKIF